MRRPPGDLGPGCATASRPSSPTRAAWRSPAS